MNAPFAADTLNSMKFAIGQPVPRQEDPTLLKGEGRYSDDVNLPNQAWCVMVRSQVAHGVIKGIDTEEARRRCRACSASGPAPTSTRRATARSRRVMMVPQRDGSPMKTPTALLARHRQGALRRRPGGLRGRRDAGAGQGCRRGGVARHRVRCPSVTDAREAAQPGAPHRVRRRAGQCLRRLPLRRHAKVDEAFAKAAHVTRLRLISNRIVVCAMEPRSAVASYDKATDRYTFHAGNQGAFGLKHQMAGAARRQAASRCAS